MDLTLEQIAAVAPDEGSLAAGRKLGNKKPWKTAGKNAAALWGECQGSALYQVRVDLSEFAYHCNCPSRKLPCKHVIGLLHLVVTSPGDVPDGQAPEWVSDWLTKRAARAKQREEKKEQPAKPADPQAQTKRAEQRQQRVSDGLDRLDLWLNDLVRNGLAGLEQQAPSFWEAPAKRLVDAQAPALATRLRKIGAIAGSTPNWPAMVLAQLGRLGLLSHAYRRSDQLHPALQADIRQAIGWTVGQDELDAQGEKVVDQWLVVGQVLEDEDRLRVQKNWLAGRRTQRSALVLQFSAAGQPFPETILPGTCLEAELLFWPSAYPQRARIAARQGETTGIAEGLPGLPTVEKFLREIASALARQPWADRFLCILNGVTPLPREASWLICDGDGRALPLAPGRHWKLLALAGGHPLDLAGEWDGEVLRPLGVYAEGRYHLLESSP